MFGPWRGSRHGRGARRYEAEEWRHGWKRDDARAAEASQEKSEDQEAFLRPDGSEAWAHGVWGQEQPGSAGCAQSDLAFGGCGFDGVQEQEQDPVAQGWPVQVAAGSWFVEGDLRLCYMMPEQRGSEEPRPAEGAKADAAGALEAPSNEEASSEPEEPVTTLMIHHVPCHYSYDNLLQDYLSLSLYIYVYIYIYIYTYSYIYIYLYL